MSLWEVVGGPCTIEVVQSQLPGGVIQPRWSMAPVGETLTYVDFVFFEFTGAPSECILGKFQFQSFYKPKNEDFVYTSDLAHLSKKASN